MMLNAIPKLLEDHKLTVTINGQRYTCLTYVDDIITMAYNPLIALHQHRLLNDHIARFGNSFNETKHELMIITNTKNPFIKERYVHGLRNAFPKATIQQHEMRYLGYYFSSTHSDSRNHMHRRIRSARFKLNQLMRNGAFQCMAAPNTHRLIITGILRPTIVLPVKLALTLCLIIAQCNAFKIEQCL